jgi:DNA repair protein SbcC/Rad50
VKILRVRFQNLNSLRGIWEIDFTAPAYAENSLFAITGPTGAGKSTLLDALCLALYGATPRLGKITKTSNQIMSRHTGVCFAEIEFSTIKGTFRCHWSQHRSRQKARGDLQQPKHEIADAANDTVLESRIRNVASKVEQVTGMDFDRFTRSTLLAQGGFAAFLQASADKRSPILEQITGTEIYSQLSIKVHDLRLLEQNRLEELSQSHSHIDLLSPEDEKLLQKTITEKDIESVFVKTEIARLRIQLSWFDSIAKLEAEVKTYSEHLMALQKNQKKHATSLSALQPALAAKEIAPLYLALNHLVDAQTKALQEKDDLNKKYNSLEETKKRVQSQTEQAEKTLQQKERERKTGLERIKDVQELDHTLHSTKKTLQEQLDTLSTKQAALEIEYSGLKTLKQNLTQAQTNKKRLDKFFKQHPEDQQLVENFGAIQLIIHTLSDLYAEQSDIAKAKEQAKQASLLRERTIIEITQKQSSLQSKVTAVTDLCNELQSAINHLLQGEKFADLQQKHFKIKNRQKNVQELLLLIKQLETQSKQTATLNKQVDSIAEQSNQREQELSLVNIELTGTLQEVDFLEKNLLLLARIQTLEEDRKQLRDESPCPLCGSINHPYNHGNMPKPSQEEKQLQKTKTELKTIEMKIEALTRKEIIAKEQKTFFTRQIAEIETQVNNTIKIGEQLLSNLELPPLSNIHLQQLQEESQNLNEAQQKLQHDLEQLEKLNQQLSTAEKQKQELAATVQQLEKELLEASHQASSANTDQQRILQQDKKLTDDLVLLNKDLSQKLRSYENFELDPKQLPQVLEVLGQRIEKWKHKKEEETLLIPNLINLHSELSHKESFCTKESKQIAASDALCALTKKSLEKIQLERLALFGNKNTTEEGARLEQSVTDTRKALSVLQHQCGDIEKDITAFSTLQNRLQEEANTRRQEIANHQEQFNKAITDSIFSGPEQFLDARRPVQEIERLQELHSTLQKKETELTTLRKEKATNLQLEKEKQLCKVTVKTLENQVQDQEKQLEATQGTAITAREQLKRNNTDKSKSAEQLAILELQKKKVGSWNRLWMLIGSADGKKFRNFAQGLTFEMMVHHANTHLRKMSDRYILVRDKTQPLDLNVIDTYQADEVRSTKNLSGGESFLVSLALALGLSRMASQNVRVDSLFLDEGFGTLDENALESALETLARLREENKLIGIISHMSALKERIPLQIQIIPGSGGNSTITGPGVTREVQ